MTSLIQSVNKERQAIELTMPSKVSIPHLEHIADTILYKGLAKMEDILDSSPDVDSCVKAFNAVINLGRYNEARKANMRKNDSEIEWDEEAYEIE